MQCILAKNVPQNTIQLEKNTICGEKQDSWKRKVTGVHGILFSSELESLYSLYSPLKWSSLCIKSFPLLLYEK